MPSSNKNWQPSLLLPIRFSHNYESNLTLPGAMKIIQGLSRPYRRVPE